MGIGGLDAKNKRSLVLCEPEIIAGQDKFFDMSNLHECDKFLERQKLSICWYFFNQHSEAPRHTNLMPILRLLCCLRNFWQYCDENRASFPVMSSNFDVKKDRIFAYFIISWFFR